MTGALLPEIVCHSCGELLAEKDCFVDGDGRAYAVHRACVPTAPCLMCGHSPEIHGGDHLTEWCGVDRCGCEGYLEDEGAS